MRVTAQQQQNSKIQQQHSATDETPVTLSMVPAQHETTGVKSSSASLIGKAKLQHKKTISTFSGDKANLAKYNTFKTMLMQYLDYYNVENDDAHSVLCDCLTGDALLWFMSYTEADPDLDYGINFFLASFFSTEHKNHLLFY